MERDWAAYYRERAEHELEAGQAAEKPEAARAHFLLAGYYFDRVFNPAAAMDEAG